MYAIGSREEMEALARHIETNNALILSALRDGDHAKAVDALLVGNLFTSMLLQAIQDHFAGRN